MRFNCANVREENEKYMVKLTDGEEEQHHIIEKRKIGETIKRIFDERGYKMYTTTMPVMSKCIWEGDVTEDIVNFYFGQEFEESYLSTFLYGGTIFVDKLKDDWRNMTAKIELFKIIPVRIH